MAVTRADAHLGARQTTTLLILAVSVCGYSLAATQLLPALPALQTRFHSSPTATAWVLTAYMLVAAPATPLIGRMGDMYGRRRMLIVVLAVFTLASVAAALAQNLPQLVACRAGQGLAGALLPLGFGIVRDVMPADRVPIGIALVGAMTAVGGSVGLPLGGLIVDHAPVDVIFWTGAGFGLIGLLGAILGIPRSPTRAPGRLDIAGAVVLSSGLVAPLIAVSFAPRWGWGSLRVLPPLAAGAVILPLWWRLECNRRDPLLNPQWLAKRSVAATMATTLVMGFGLFGTFSLLPRLAQSSTALGGLGMSPFTAGALMFPTAFVNATVAPIVGIIGRARGSKLPLRAGCVVAALGLAWLSALHHDAFEIAGGCAILGVGFAAAMAAAPNIIVGHVSWEETGAAMAANTLVQNLGSSIGSQVTVTIVVSRTAADGNISGGYTWAFAVAAAAAVAAALICSLIRGERRAPERPHAAEFGLARIAGDLGKLDDIVSRAPTLTGTLPDAPEDAPAVT